MLRVIVKDRCAQRHLTHALRQQLAHLQRNQPGKFFGTLAHDGGGPGKHFSALGVGLFDPNVTKAGRCSSQFFFELGGVDFLERLQHFSVEGIDTLISHECSLSSNT